MYDAYIYAGARTPFGRYGGALASVRPDDLLAKVLQEVLHSCPKAGAFVEDIVIGAANQAGEDCRNIARMAGLLAGIPIDVAGQTVNRLCGSSLSAVMDVARAIHCGDGRLYIAGGVESMSRAPFVIGKAESAYSRSANIFDSSIGERFPNPALTAMVGSDSMPETADNVAAAFDISREDCDRFSLASQTKYRLASEAGFYESEIVAVELPSRRKQPALQVSRDEHPRSDTTYEALQALKPLFSGGVVTAGNASGINDGAVALLLGTREVGSTIGLRPRGRVIAGAVAGVEPKLMGIGPVEASRKALARTNLRLRDMDVIELNEAFAAQALGCLKLLDIDFNDSRVNPNGGAIAIGHPLGASGSRIVLTALRQLESSGGRFALATMCIGMGQGIALIIERV